MKNGCDDSEHDLEESSGEGRSDVEDEIFDLSNSDDSDSTLSSRDREVCGNAGIRPWGEVFSELLQIFDEHLESMVKINTIIDSWGVFTSSICTPFQYLA